MGTCGAEDPSAAASSRAINGCDRVVEGITPSPMMGGLVAAWCWHCPADVGSTGESDLIASAPMIDGFMAAWCWRASDCAGTSTGHAGAVHTFVRGLLCAGDLGTSQIVAPHPTAADSSGTELDVDAEACPDPKVAMVKRSTLGPTLGSGGAIELVLQSFCTRVSPN
jgi:hypothetical protein